MPSKTELDTAEATLARAIANQAVADAAVRQCRASLSSAETNLSKASIRSPIDGVVLSREVEPGQTVAASFQVATLFTLAEDLKQMELEVDVAEADVGQVREGQVATFSVDAYSNRKYEARIRRVSYGSQTTSGVVTYKTVLTVNNDDLTLRPGMTATAEITTIEHKDVLLVPNAARPLHAARGRRSRAAGQHRLAPAPAAAAVLQPGERAATGRTARSGTGQVYVLKDGMPVAVPVTIGPSNGRLTEVTSERARRRDAGDHRDRGSDRVMSAEAAGTPLARAARRDEGLRAGAGRAPGPEGHRPHDRGGRVRGHHGAERLRQVDDDEHPRLPGHAHRGGLRLPRHAPRADLSRRQRALVRRHYLGFVFQGFNLLARTSALENVELPLALPRRAARRPAEGRPRGARVGGPRRAGRGTRRPSSRAGSSSASPSRGRSSADPVLLLADEPTGNLDTQRSREIMDLLASLNRDRGLTVVMVTHEADMASYARRVVHFLDGVVDRDHRNGGPH